MSKRLEVPAGTRFNHLVVIREVERTNPKKRRFLCKCDCGNTCEVDLAQLKHSQKTCGCTNWLKPKTDINEYIGKRFGMLTIIEGAGYSESRKIQVKCRCDCGNEKIVCLCDLKYAGTQSCGCKRRIHDGIEMRTKESLYGVWQDMKARCDNPNEKSFHNYGGRGISYCKQWRDYSNFRKWALENGYSKGLTLDRINVNGNYEPSNCRWVTMKVQSNNTRKNINVTYHGETHTLAEWSDITGIRVGRLYARYHRGFALDVVFSKKRLASRGIYERRE